MTTTPSDTITVSVDVMGGDFGLEATLPGLSLITREDPSVRFQLYGDEATVEQVLANYPKLQNRVSVHHCESVVSTEAKPTDALRDKKSSMYQAINAVKEGAADAVVSSGNTGALMAMATLAFRQIEGVHRPAIASVFPTKRGRTVMLDLGANMIVKAGNMVEFAVLGAAFAKAQLGVNDPLVGLLNVGTEDTKGPDHVRDAAKILKDLDFPGRYHGFVEGTDITNGAVDVVVSDGYAGNIALKTAEGVGKLTNDYVRQAMTSGVFSKIGALFAYYALQKLKKQVDPRRYNGGVFLGLNGLCVKSHGGSDALAFSSAVALSIRLAREKYVQKVTQDLQCLKSLKMDFS